MKFKVGDKVKYDGGDWWFYGTVNAVFEHSICPCYRVSVDRMEKKSCKFSITQFEFELEAHGDVDSSKDRRKWENSEVEYLKKYYGVLNNEDLSKVLRRTPQAIEEKWQSVKSEPKHEPKPELKLEAVPQQMLEPKPRSKPGRKPGTKLVKKSENIQVKKPVVKPETEKVNPRKGIKRGEAWERNFELYQKGAKSSVITAWIAQNRREYKVGKLKEEKFEKLMGINFPFDPAFKKKK